MWYGGDSLEKIELMHCGVKLKAGGVHELNTTALTGYLLLLSDTTITYDIAP